MLMAKIRIKVKIFFTKFECTVSSDTAQFTLMIQQVNIYLKGSNDKGRSAFALTS